MRGESEESDEPEYRLVAYLNTAGGRQNKTSLPRSKGHCTHPRQNLLLGLDPAEGIRSAPNPLLLVREKASAELRKSLTWDLLLFNFCLFFVQLNMQTMQCLKCTDYCKHLRRLCNRLYCDSWYSAYLVGGLRT